MQYKLINVFTVLKFKTGKRKCPGEPLAEVEVFMYFTALLQKYKFYLSPGQKPDMEGALGIGLDPMRQEICFKRR